MKEKRFKAPTALLLFFVCICCSCNINSQSNTTLICDTIYSINSGYISGKKIYETNNSDRVILCLLCGNKEDTLIILTNLFASDFSLGGPYNQEKDTVLRSKFKKFKESVYIEQDRMDLFDDEDSGPPYYFSVIMGKDTIIYQSDLHKQNYYGFVEASLYEPRFLYADYQVGKKIKNCSLGNVLTDETINRIQYIELLPCDDYIYPNNCKRKTRKLWYVKMDVYKGYIEHIHISSLEN